jgi:hypothetical protein
VEEYHLTPDELIRGDEQQRGTIHGKPFSAISVYPAFFVAFYSTTLLTSYLDMPDWASVAF